jgi:2-C-methyl-D-erythritol 4-phosphate cytidylyltransferase/2-C-methyl-D-erythritol 2,4-cyclodiphosphate synthase
LAKKPIIAAIVVAAGKGERASVDGDPAPKQYRTLAGKSVLARSIEAMLAADGVRYVLPVLHADHSDRYTSLGLGGDGLLPPITGGETRQQSVLEGLAALRKYEPDLVLIHDAARPLVDRAVIAAVIEALETHDGAVPAIPVTDTIKRSPDGTAIAATEDRRRLFAAQTPQGFRFEKILAAHREAATTTEPFTDDASIGEWAGLDVVITPGSERNLKVTLPDDFARAERLLGGQRMETRTGSGIDVHQFEAGDHVWLGGVHIPHTHRLVGHSDADAALHAITDALYGAIGEGDIGTHFPPSDPQWKGTASKTFLEHAAGLVHAHGGRIVNVDVTIVCEAPRIGPHVAAMKEAIADMCGISPSRVAVKATTSETLGFTGRKEGLFASAVATVELPCEA